MSAKGINKLCSIARVDDLIEASGRRFRDQSSAALIEFLRLGSSLSVSTRSGVEHACQVIRDCPEARHWQATVSRLSQTFSGEDVGSLSSIIGYLAIDRPEIERVFQLLAWQIAASAFDDGCLDSLFFDNLPPAVLSVGSRGAFDRERIDIAEHCPTTLVRTGDSLELVYESAALRQRAGDSGWIQSITFSGGSLQASIPLHQSNLLNRDHQDFPVVESRIYAQRWLRDVAGAAILLDQYSTLNILRLITAVVPAFCLAPAVGSASREEALGLVFLPATDRIDQIVECLLHEALHQYLFRLEECADLFASDSPSEARFYSPWRDDGRPLRMILHGAFVFAGVADFYLWDGLASLQIDTKERHRRAYHRAQQARTALATIMRYGRLTKFGHLTIECIEAALDLIAACASPSSNDRSGIDTAMAQHASRFSTYDR